MAHTVLVVDDDADIRESLQAVLEDEGYAVTTAADGAKAVAAMQLSPPCMVILDLMMPIMDGWAVAERMQREARLAAIPVCIVTATPERAPAASRYVMPKPIDLARLLDVLRSSCPSEH